MTQHAAEPTEPVEPAESAGATDDAESAAATKPAPTLLEQLGGVSGLIASTVPIVVFVLVNAIFGLMPAIWGALGCAAAIAVFRLVRKENVQPAISGALGVGFGAFIAYRMGEAKGFFLLGIWASLLYAGLFAGSLLVRRPLVGVLWHLLRGDGQKWRADRQVLRGYDIATLTWMVVFVARFVVQRWLYDNDETGALGVARLAMGLPLTLVALLVTVWAARRAGRMLDALAATTASTATAQSAGVADGAAEPAGKG